jgi:hypothetical protein
MGLMYSRGAPGKGANVPALLACRQIFAGNAFVV